MATAVETVKNFMNVLKNYSQDDSQVGRIALDEAVRRVTTFSSLGEAVDELKKTLADTETYPDTTTRLQKATGMIIGKEGDYSADTGAISGANAGGSTTKNAASIVPEDNVDLSTLSLPTPGSTTPITYTGDDGKSFTFYVKWPDNFMTVVDGFKEGAENYSARMYDSRYRLDLNTLNDNDYYEFTETKSDGTTETVKSPTYGQMKNAVTTAIKGLYNYWLGESAKLNYDSLGLALNGQTIGICFCTGGEYNEFSADTESIRKDTLPADNIIIGICLYSYGILNPTDPNGSTNYEDGKEGMYLDRVIAHEMVHAVMFTTGTLKNDMPQFFTEGIADLVQGDDDYYSMESQHMVDLVTNSDTLAEALNFAEGTGSTYAYPAGDMFMRYLAQQSLDVTSIFGNNWQVKTYSYDTGDAVITNYKSSDTIDYQRNFGDAWTSQTLNDLIIKEKTDDNSENLLVLRDVRGKNIYFNTPNGRAYAYMAENSSEVNGNNFGDGNGYEILFGSDYKNDIVRAGNGGSQLWGGMQGNDELFGGAGVDTFDYRYYGGHDSFQDAESQDNIFLKDMTLDKISGAMFTDYGTYFKFADGGSLVVNGTPSTFLVEDENKKITTYNADYQNKVWTLTV